MVEEDFKQLHSRMPVAVAGSRRVMATFTLFLLCVFLKLLVGEVTV